MSVSTTQMIKSGQQAIKDMTPSSMRRLFLWLKASKSQKLDPIDPPYHL